MAHMISTIFIVWRDNITPKDLPQFTRWVKETVQRDDIRCADSPVIFAPGMPLWIYGGLLTEFMDRPWVGFYSRHLKQAVVVHSRDETVPVGTMIKPPPEGIQILFFHREFLRKEELVH